MVGASFKPAIKDMSLCKKDKASMAWHASTPPASSDPSSSPLVEGYSQLVPTPLVLAHLHLCYRCGLTRLFSVTIDVLSEELSNNRELRRTARHLELSSLRSRAHMGEYNYTGLNPLRKARTSVVDAQRSSLTLAGRSVGPTPPLELNTIIVLGEWRVEPWARGGAHLGRQEG